MEAFFAEVELAAGADPRLDDAVAAVKKELADLDDLELRARRVVEQLALVLQGSLLVRHAPAAVADAFCATRLGRDWGGAFGTLPARPRPHPGARPRRPVWNDALTRHLYN